LTLIKLDDHKLIKRYISPRDQDILASINQILTENNTTLADLTHIQVYPGPGSFTGTRVGVTIANALAFALKIPINGQKTSIEPIYDLPPNITQPK
jgi:tRNA threonylcarbamoyladenosine biosynthesis protein TsaB